MRSFSDVKLTKKAFLREEGGPLAVEGALRYNIKKQIFIVTHSPSVDFVDSSLPEGAFRSSSSKSKVSKKPFPEGRVAHRQSGVTG